MPYQPSPLLIIGVFELLLFLILIALGLTAYYKYNNKAVKYAMIIFTLAIFQHFLPLIVAGLGLKWNSGKLLYSISTLIIFLLCLTAFVVGIRWYVKIKEPVVLCLLIAFGMYALSSLSTFLSICNLGYEFDVLEIGPYIFGPPAYIIGISAMIIGLVLPKPQRDQAPQ